MENLKTVKLTGNKNYQAWRFQIHSTSKKNKSLNNLMACLLIEKKKQKLSSQMQVFRMKIQHY